MSTSPKTESDTQIIVEANLSAFFNEVVAETVDHIPCSLSHPMKEYVVGLLEDSARDQGMLKEAVDRPLALVLAEAMEAEPASRFERLRQTGDGILLMGGLYRRHLRRSGLKDGYVVALGQRAYLSASSLLDFPVKGLNVGGSSPYDLLGDLADGFFDLMVLLRAVADTIVARAARSAHDLARLCEMWLSDGSSHLGRMLRAHGVILERTPGLSH